MISRAHINEAISTLLKINFDVNDEVLLISTFLDNGEALLVRNELFESFGLRFFMIICLNEVRWRIPITFEAYEVVFLTETNKPGFAVL